MKNRRWPLFLAALVTLVAAFAVATSTALADDPPAPNLTIPLNNDTAEEGEDCPAEGGPYWHFVISPNNGHSAFIVFHLNLGDGLHDIAVFIMNEDQWDNVFVAVPDGYEITDLVKDLSTADIYWDGEKSDPDKFQLSHICSGGGGGGPEGPTITKIAAGSYDDTFTWDIDKSADTDTVYSAGGGMSGAVNYTVTLSHSESVVSNVKVSGTITVTNPNSDPLPITGVTDELSDGTDCVVTGGGAQNLPAGDTPFSYECSLDGLPEGGLTNTATVTWDGEPASHTTLPIEFTANEIDKCVDVSDTLAGDLGDVCVGDDDLSIEYPLTFTDPAGTCTDHTNTASFTADSGATGSSDPVTVKDCQGADLTVEKTATPSFTRNYDWTIDKSVTQSVPGSKTFDYTIKVDVGSFADSDWKVSGTIKVSNPNDWQDIEADITDSLPGGTCSVTGGTDVNVPAEGSVSVDYSCTFLSNPGSGTNTATATWDAAAAHTLNGSASGTADFTFGNPTNLIDECIDVKDDNGTPNNAADDKSFGQVCVGDAPKTFTYSVTLSVNDAQCITRTNTASYTTSDDANDTDESGSDSVTVSYCAPATIGYWKTHIRACATKEKTGTGGCNNNGPFAVTYLPKYLGNYKVDTGAKALAVFDANNCSNASTSDNNAAGCLAAQLLGAKLNVAFGSPSCINATIALADAFLINNVSPTYAGPTGGPYVLNTRAQAIALKDLLDNYNKGLGCPI